MTRQSTGVWCPLLFDRHQSLVRLSVNASYALSIIERRRRTALSGAPPFRRSEGMHGHQLPDMDVHRFFNGEPLPDPFQHQRFLFRKSVTLVIPPEEKPAPAVRPGIHRMVEADPRGHIEAADHPGQL